MFANIPKLPPGGWTRDYAGQLNEFVDRIIPLCPHSPYRGLVKGELAVLDAATTEDWRRLKDADIARLATEPPSPEAWTRWFIAARYFHWALWAETQKIKERREQ